MLRILLAAAILTGCTSYDGSLITKEGFTEPSDPCVKLGNVWTNDPSDRSADVIGCPPGATPPEGRWTFPLGNREGLDRFVVGAP